MRTEFKLRHKIILKVLQVLKNLSLTPTNAFAVVLPVSILLQIVLQLTEPAIRVPSRDTYQKSAKQEEINELQIL